MQLVDHKYMFKHSVYQISIGITITIVISMTIYMFRTCFEYYSGLTTNLHLPHVQGCFCFSFLFISIIQFLPVE